MTFTDLFVTPVYLILFYVLAYIIKPYVTDNRTGKYFIPAYTVKIIGALALGFVYQFYYSGGDTYNFYSNSSIIFEAFLDNPAIGFKILFSDGTFDANLFSYASRIYYYSDSSTFFVVKLAGFLSLFAFNSYTVIACMFATISFSGLWCMYLTFYRLYPHLYKLFAYAVLFIPSVFFWGSGYLKDTITLGAVGWAVYSVHQFFIEKKSPVGAPVLFVIASYILLKVKVYILLCILPALILWIFLRYSSSIKSTLFRYLVTPMVIVLAAGAGFYAIQKVGESNHRYSLNAMAETAEETARWLAQVSAWEGGSAYSLGDFDYSTAGMMRKALPAINVTLFRPYVWEVNNVVMLLSALESLFLLLFTLYVIYKKGLIGVLKSISSNPTVIFCLIFALSFSFAVGISTYNFGSLVRYKIPMLPFYLAALIIILKPKPKLVQLKRRRNKGKETIKENNLTQVPLPISFSG